MNEIYHVIKKLRKIQIPVSLGELVEIYKSLSIKNLAKYLTFKGISESEQSAFDHLLGEGQPGYVKKQNMTSKKAIELIKQVGGIAVLAHPYRIRLTETGFDEFMKHLISEGLDGIEIYHAKQQNVEYYQAIQKKYHLIGTGGSDLHSDQKELLGMSYLNTEIPYNLFKQMEKYL